MANNRIKVAGYAQRIFFNDNIEYRDFSPDLVGFQLTSDGGTTLFTNGNFSISVNLDPKPDTLFLQGKKSKFFTLDDIVEEGTPQLEIQKNIKTKLNIDLTNPLSYIWYGSSKELIRASLLEIQEKWPAAIYVDNKVGSVTGNNITNYVYDIETDESTFTVNSNYFVNPYGIKYTLDSQYVGNNDNSNPLRNFTLNYSSYLIEHNGISKKIKSITPSIQKTNSTIELVVEGNPFPELTGIFIPQLSFLFNNVDASIPYFIKPNESEIEKFFSGLNELQSNLLNRNIYPKYKSEVISTNYTDDGVLLTSKSVLTFPVLEDGYNLNFFDSFYIAYVDQLNDLGEGLDSTKTDIIIRKYTTEAISSFDSIPRTDAADLVLNGEKATKLLRIYGVEFDYIKKYINAIKFAHVVTYDKKNNVPDSLVKDLAFMLGLEPVNFLNQSSLSELLLPSNGSGLFSGTSTNLTQTEIDVELYRRLILNIAWLWKSKGTRKAIEFLFRFIGAPESLINFNEYVVIVDKPLEVEEIKKLLYLYTGEVNYDTIPYDENGFPLPPTNGDLVINNFIDPETGQIVENEFTDMYFQKGGGWYRETYGSNVNTILNGNNPHIGSYDGGNEYLQYFSKCYIPNFDNQPTVTLTAKTIVQNYFLNYNYGIFNGIDNSSQIYTNQLTFNPLTNTYQPINTCLDVEYSIIETPLQNDGKTTLQQAFSEAQKEYNDYLELIKENSYLKYSPEWQIIKNNYELSLKNCLNEITTENCDINKTLEICLLEKQKNDIEYSCDSLNVVNNSPFIYYTNDDGIKVSFDEFPSCCNQQDGRFISYVNEYGRETEYCSKLAPCVGTPSETLPNGVIVFTMTNNTIPKDIIQVDGKCFQYINTNLTLQEFTKEVGGDYLTYIKNYCTENVKYDSTSKIDTNCSNYFKEVSCNNTTIVSSPECCAWYGYDYEIIEQNGNSFIVCKENNKIYSPETSTLIDSTQQVNYTLPIIDFSVNNSYYELQNPIGGVYQYYSTEIFWDSFNDSRIIKGVVEGSTSLSPQPNSILEDPLLMNPSNWKVDFIDEYNRVSFTPKIFNNNFILDWYSSDLLSDLYKSVATYYGFEFGKFTFDYENNSLKPFTGDDSFSTKPNSTFTAAVDGSRVTCEDLNNVSVLFASEKWKGFKLPELDDCSCTIDFSFDYMLKYNLNSLTECANQITCHPAFIYDNTIDNINCLNFVAFTNGTEKSQELESNFNDNQDVKEEYELWQNSNVLEPNIECCNAIGGNVLPYRDFIQSNSLWVDQITTTYGGILSQNTTILSSLNFNYVPILNEIQKYNTLKNNLIELVSTLPTSCFVFNFNVEPCDILYENYITTTNVCSINAPLECGLWSKLYGDFEKLSSEINRLIELYNSNISYCLKIAEAVGLTTTFENTPAGPPAKEIKTIDNIKESNKLDTQKQQQIDSLKISEINLKNTINDINNTITQKESVNSSINKALTNINTELNCSVYENSIRELDNFNYQEYCNSIVYNGGINDGKKITEFNNCVTLKTQENNQQKLIYTELLNLCISKNQTNEQLVKSKFDNNTVLTSTLEKEIQDINVKINELTTNANSFISFDESLQTSKLQQNDVQNTINVVSEILKVNPNSIVDKSGNIVLSDSQKIKLNVELTKNESQISKLNREKQENVDSLSENIKNQKFIEYGTEFIQNNDNLNTSNTDINIIPENLTETTIGLSSARDIKIETPIGGGGRPISDCPEVSEITVEGGVVKYYIVNQKERILSDIPRECCTKELLQLDVRFKNGECVINTTSPPISDCPKVSEITVVGGVVKYNIGTLKEVKLSDIPRECCTKELLQRDVRFKNGECVINTTPPTSIDSCCLAYINFSPDFNGTIDTFNELLNQINESIEYISIETTKCYDNWYNSLVQNYNNYNQSTNNYLNFIDNLKLNFKLFVDNNNIDVNNNIDTSLTYLPYTQSVNPIWEFDPTQGYSGILLEGDEQTLALVEQSIFSQLSSQNINYNSNLFEPDWKTFNFTIPECVCDDLRRLYPNKEFYFSIGIENYECDVCLLVDNIMVNVSDCKTDRIVSINDCLIPQLSCVIDNKKSWVYYDDGVVKETIYPNGECNTETYRNFEVTKFKSPQERLWTDLEYRYTNYDNYHSDLLINVKNTTFSIDPAKSIECDVFNFWKKIDCNNCPTSCEIDSKIFQSGEDFLFMEGEDYIFQDQNTTSTYFSGILNIGNTSYDYNLDLDGSTSNILPFSCETYTNLLQNEVIELKNKYYSLTANYSESLNSTYYNLIEKGGTLSNFYISKNNCGGNTLVLNSNNQIDNLFNLIVEDGDGSISLFDVYIYSGTPIYVGGYEQEILSGVTAQTFNQTSNITKECCESINKLINKRGVNGLGLGENYQWNEENSSCNWYINSDCSYCKTTIGDCYISESSNPLECPPGSELVDGQCLSVEIFDVFLNPTIYIADIGERDGNYGKFGMRIYENVDSYTLPLKSGYGGYLRDNNNVYIPLNGASPVSNIVWDSQGTSSRGRLNISGIWTGSGNLPLREWIGFSTCITVSETKVYCIGLAADNRMRCKINGNLIVQFGGATTNPNFNYWHVIPITLYTGVNIIELEGWNDNSVASFGAEIYDATPEQLIHVTSPAELENEYLIWSTKDRIGFDFDIGEKSGYTCPDGSSYDSCFGGRCIRYTYTPLDEIIQEEKNCECSVPSGQTSTICINPLDFLDFDPSTINVKDTFDQLVLSNLIDVKSRQTIGDYPLLRLFYELYLNANNCGEDLSGKLTYDTMFEFMDKIGDYWLDLIEQVVPATTIWQGCDNSGKIYRNLIFDQNKFKYKKYSLNFSDRDECLIKDKTNFSISEKFIDSLVEQKPIYPTNEEIVSIKNQIRNKEIEISITVKQINAVQNRLCSLNLQDNDTFGLENLKNQTNQTLLTLNNSLTSLNNQLTDLFNQLTTLETQVIQQESNFNDNFMSCSGLSQTLTVAENNLSNYSPGTTSYERQRNFIASLRDKYNKCVRKSNTLISDYDLVFITQIYDSNEYEGNVTIFGDPDWDEGGPFYNKELIHNC